MTRDAENVLSDLGQMVLQHRVRAGLGCLITIGRLWLWCHCMEGLDQTQGGSMNGRGRGRSGEANTGRLLWRTDECRLGVDDLCTRVRRN